MTTGSGGHQAVDEIAELPGRRSVMGVLLAIAANIGAFLLLFQLYKVVRKQFIQRAESVAYDNAQEIIDLERRLRLFFEPDLQQWVIGHEWMIRALNYYYAWFMWTFYGCCVVAIVFSPVRYRPLRRVFLLSMLLALPWYAIYPLAPPRFMPLYGFVDTLAVYGPNYFSEGGAVAANRFAAMPSMHIGWSTIGAMMLAVAIPKWRIGFVFCLAHITLMTVTVMATGNHYWLDAVGGWLVVAAAFAVARLLPQQLPRPWGRADSRPVAEPVQRDERVPV